MRTNEPVLYVMMHGLRHQPDEPSSATERAAPRRRFVELARVLPWAWRAIAARWRSATAAAKR